MSTTGATAPKETDSTMTDTLLPPEVFEGYLGDYVAAMTPTTEAPAEFHLMAFATVLGLVFADVSIEGGTYATHPTLFTILVGPTGQARKTTVNKAAIRALHDIAPEVVTIDGEGSSQGLMAALIRTASPNGIASMATLEATQQGRLNVTPPAIGAVGAPTLVKVHEFTKVLRQASRTATADLTEFYLRLYDRPDVIENNTRGTPMRLIDPVVAVLGDSTEEALADVFGQGNISNGFLNRLSIARGTYLGDPKPRPPAPDPEAYEAVIEGVREVRADIPAGTVVGFTAEGGQAYDDLYCEVITPRAREGGLGEAVAREAGRVLSFAMLYALQDGRTLIEPGDISRGWLIAEYLADSALSLAGKVGAGDRAKALDYVLGRIEAKGPEGVRVSATDAPGEVGVGYLQRLISAPKRSAIRAYGLAALAAQLVRDGEVAVLTPAQLLRLGVTTEHSAMVARSHIEAATS